MTAVAHSLCMHQLLMNRSIHKRLCLHNALYAMIKTTKLNGGKCNDSKSTNNNLKEIGQVENHLGSATSFEQIVFDSFFCCEDYL